MADANVLLRISSDVGNAITGINSFINIVGMATAKIADFAKKNDEFARAANAATVSIREADEATGGLIDTTALYQQQNKLAMAGIQVTEHQYRALAAASAEMGQVTGDATGEFKRLTDALARGSTREMMRYGIEVKSTGDKSEDTAAAIEELTKRFGDTTVEAKDLTQSLFVLQNNLDTFIGLLWKGANDNTSLGGALSLVNKEFGNMNNLISKFPSIVGNVDIAFVVLKEAVADLLQPLQAVEDAMNAFRGIGPGQGKIGGIREGLQEDAETLRRRIENRMRLDQAIEADRQAANASSMQGASQIGGKKGGKKGKKKEDDGSLANESDVSPGMDFVAEQRWQEQEQFFADIGASGAGSIGGLGLAGGINSPLGGPKTAQEIEAEADARKKAMELQRQQIELEREYWNQSVDFSRNWSESWIQSIDEVDAKMAIISTTMRGFEDVTRGVVSTIAKGGKMTVKAVADMVKGVALNIGIEATVQALMNTAKAIAEGVSSWGASPRIEGFATAAASYAATAAVAFSVAGAAGAISKSRGGGKDRQAAAGGNYSERDFADSMAGRHRDQGGNVTVILQGDAESLFKAVVVENDRSMQSGNSAFSMS